VDSVIILDSTLRARIEALARELGVNSYYEVVNYLINYYYTTKRSNLCRVVTPWLVRWFINANSREWVRHALGPGLTRELERLGRELARECGGNNG
jgi:chemotaxis methyl-accepting protein methylase